MKFRDLGPQERIEYADLYNKACITDAGELRSTEDAATELRRLIAQAIYDDKTWAKYERGDIEDLGYRTSVKNWTDGKYRHLTKNGQRRNGQTRIRSRKSVARVPQRREGIEEQMVLQWVNKTYEECEAADLRKLIQRSSAQIVSEDQTVRDCTRLLALLDNTGVTTVRDALLLIGKTLSEFLTAAEAAS